jgi:hypothetical protein
VLTKSRRLTVVATALGAALTLAGCSGDSGTTPNAAQGTQTTSAEQTRGSSGLPPTSGTAAQPPAPGGGAPQPSGGDSVKWADNLCAPIGDFVKSISTKMADISSATDQAQMQAKLGQFLDDMANGLGTTVDSLKKLEPSPVKGGDQARDRIVGAYAKSKDVLKEAAAKMRAGDQDAASQVMETLGNEAASVADPFRDDDAPELRAAIKTAPKCKDMAGG